MQQKKDAQAMDIASVLERRRGRLAAKRAMDIVLSAGALCVLWPVFLLLAAAIVADDPGPVSYTHLDVYKRQCAPSGTRF